MNATDGKKLVLIVDDAPANLQMMRSILKDDFKIRVATSGAKALDLVKAEPHPDLILLDVMMPQMDGYEVCGLLFQSELRHFARRLRGEDGAQFAAFPLHRC
jgi:sigma-B regulation protein RsbU (phosphoserine phosphatase)